MADVLGGCPSRGNIAVNHRIIFGLYSTSSGFRPGRKSLAPWPAPLFAGCSFCRDVSIVKWALL